MITIVVSPLNVKESGQKILICNKADAEVDIREFKENFMECFMCYHVLFEYKIKTSKWEVLILLIFLLNHVIVK